MTPDAAIRMTKHGRRLLRRGLLAPHDYTVLDCLVWSCRKPGASMTSVTYKALAGLCGMCRERAMQAVARLVALGLVAKARTRRFVRWGVRGGLRRSIQGPNLYTLAAPHTEAVRPAADSVRVKSLPLTGGLKDALEALERRLAGKDSTLQLTGCSMGG
jgi:hypothetical protein